MAEREVDYRGLAEYLIGRAGEDPDAVWRDVDKRAASEKRNAVIERTRREGRPAGRMRSDPLQEEGAKAFERTFVPQSPADAALFAMPWLRAGKAIPALAAGIAASGDEAQAGGASLAERALKAAGRFVNEPQRALHPGIYKRPDVIAREAADNVAPEHPALQQLFGVTRDDLYEIGGRGTRQGNMEPSIATRPNARGSYAADAIMTPQNARRMVDTLGEAEKYPQLTRGMDSWYVMDPAYQRMAQLLGPERAAEEYKRFNTVTSMFSPGSAVPTEINRGTAANMMINRGEWPTFSQYGGMAAKDRGIDYPEALRDVIGHPYHSTAQAGPVGRYLERGTVDMSQPKVPLYMQASGVPETGFQTRLPVPDAHFTRAVGMSDVRKNANPGASMKTPEYAEFGPWYRENVAQPLGIEAVPAQARMWGTYAPQTGVDTPVGAPKLELLAQAISERAQKLGIDPQKLRDDVLTGKAHATWLAGALVPAGMAATGTGDQSNAADRL